MRKLYVYSVTSICVICMETDNVFSGQTSLPESCPVCEHNPVSPDLCKPNKALRTTLKAFLRTEEKKREKDRPSTTPAVTTAPTSNVPVETQGEPAIPATKTVDTVVSAETVTTEPAADIAADKPSVDENEAPPGASSVQVGSYYTPLLSFKFSPFAREMETQFLLRTKMELTVFQRMAHRSILKLLKAPKLSLRNQKVNPIRCFRTWGLAWWG